MIKSIFVYYQRYAIVKKGFIADAIDDTAYILELIESEFHFLQASKPQKTCISFFAGLKNLKEHEFHFLRA